MATTGTPCFPDKPPLAARTIYQELERDSAVWYLGKPDEEWPKPRTYGSCTVARGKITEADGSLVAELSCGVRVVRRGIVDEHGIEIGARGTDVIERVKSSTPLRCLSNGPGQVRCTFDRTDDGDTDGNSYVVAGDMGDEAMLHGDHALAYFRTKQIVEMLVSVWCH